MQRLYPADATLVEGEVELRVGTQEVNAANPLPVSAAAANMQVNDADVSRTNPVPTEDEAYRSAAAYIDVPGPDTAAVVALAPAGGYHEIGGVAWSYSGAPTGGRLTIVETLITVLDIDIIVGGPGSIIFPGGLRSGLNTFMTITLAAGGAGIFGKVNILSYRATL